MQVALVTGATGFIGHHLVARLRQEGWQVRCLVRSTSRTRRLEELGAELVHGDVTRADSLNEAVSGAEAVFHLAGLTKSTRAARLWAVNEGGTRAVAQACAAVASPPVLVYVSSLAAAGPSANGTPRTEADRPAPVSAYGRSKQAGEVAVQAFADRVPMSIVRPPIVLGEGDRDGLEMFRGIARWNVHLVPGLVEQAFSVIHAADLAEALLGVAHRGRRLDASDPQAGTYFVSADEVVGYGELGQMVGRAVGRMRVRVIRSPHAAVWGIAAVNELVSQLRRRPHILNLDKAREATAGGWACNDAALRRDTAFRPAHSLQERLDQTARWYLEQGWLPRVVTP